MRIVRTGRTWAIVTVEGRIVEGGYFTKAAAEDALYEIERDRRIVNELNAQRTP